MGACRGVRWGGNAGHGRELGREDALLQLHPPPGRSSASSPPSQVRNEFYKDAQGCVLVYDVTSRSRWGEGDDAIHLTLGVLQEGDRAPPTCTSLNLHSIKAFNL